MNRGTTGYMTLNLSGKRTPPNLEVPPVINCGDCLVGNSKTIKLICRFVKNLSQMIGRNKGGQGECKVVLDNSSSSIYSVIPKEFSLEAGQDIELAFIFAPRQERAYSNTVTFQYDTHEEVILFSVRNNSQELFYRRKRQFS